MVKFLQFSYWILGQESIQNADAAFLRIAHAFSEERIISASLPVAPLPL
jgi:hypothetical protein